MPVSPLRKGSLYRAVDFDARKVDETERSAAVIWIRQCADLLASLAVGSPDEQELARFLREKPWWRERNLAKEDIFPRSHRTAARWKKSGTLRRLREACVARLTAAGSDAPGLETFFARQRALSWRMSWAEWNSLLADIPGTDDDAVAGISFFLLHWCIPADGMVVARQRTARRFTARFWQYEKGAALFTPDRIGKTLRDIARERREVELSEICAALSIPLSANAVVAEVFARSPKQIVFWRSGTIVVRRVLPRHSNLRRWLPTIQRLLAAKSATIPELRAALHQHVSRKSLLEVLVPMNEIFRLDTHRFGSWQAVEEQLEGVGITMREIEDLVARALRSTESAVTSKDLLIRCSTLDARMRAINVWLLRSVAARMRQFALLPYGQIGRRRNRTQSAAASLPQTLTEHLAPTR